MRKVIASVFISLDGVIQAPGGPTEDPTGDFKLGGWLPKYSDEEVSKQVGTLFSGSFDLLLGRRTYDIFAAYWPFVEGGPGGLPELFNRAQKFVVTHGRQPLDWQNSHRVTSLAALAEVKRSDGPDLIIQGSSTLYPQLLKEGLIDRLTLIIFPIILGPGKRLFGEGTAPRSMRILEHKLTPRGNIIATYEPGGEVETGSFHEDRPSPAELARRKKMAEGTW
jgi:dihydrofolate reductase